MILQIVWRSKPALFSIFLFYFLIFSIAIIVFPLGFGFDPFVHQATLELIAENGAVSPKPLYYLGEYSLLTIINKIPFVSLSLLHFYLVPLLAAIFIPATLYLALRKWLRSKQTILLSALALLIIPFGILIFTTPQNLAFLFLILIIILSLKSNSWPDLILVYALALAALATHAIAGIPAVLFALVLTLYHSNIKNKKYIFIILYSLLIIALPLAFSLVNKANGTNAEIATSANAPLLSISNPNTENIILNTVYFYALNLRFILLALAIAGIIIAWRHRQTCAMFSIYLLASLSLFTSYLITSKLNFSYLIFYEQSNFANRILILSFLFLLPFIALSLAAFINKLREQNRFMQISFGLFICFLILISTYLSYPRFDNYHNSHSYTVSQSDINAVNWIEANKENEDYIVLANQQVSAAALHEFGFKKYYSISELSSEVSELSSEPAIFYYPIPTGGLLYQYYLNMVYEKPSRETMLKAMELTGVNEAYFVLNKYWWASDKILAEAKLEADSYEIIDKGEIYVFRYLK
ncbi:hypothetical protein KAJ89_05430 [Candidatus Parcubacteria bacterium]|nr:hypothetical protein [Candidatus Parcubacteria bacterium]